MTIVNKQPITGHSLTLKEETLRILGIGRHEVNGVIKGFSEISSEKIRSGPIPTQYPEQNISISEKMGVAITTIQLKC